MKSPPNSGNGIYNNPWPPASSLEALRCALNLAIANNNKKGNLKNSTDHLSTANLNLQSAGNVFCDCLSQLNHICHGPHLTKFNYNRNDAQWEYSNLDFNSDMGRMIYTISILLMFSLVILLLMVRSIRQSSSTIEVETLLDSMRFREELDLQQRQKRRLQRAKHKVTTWLSKANGKMWANTPQIILPTKQGMTAAAAANYNRTNSLQSGGSYIPEIVISNSEEGGEVGGANYNYIGPGPSISRRQNSCTPSLSLIYDFNNTEEDMDMVDGSEADLSQFSDLSYNTIGSTADIEVRINLSESHRLLPSGEAPQLSSPWITQKSIAEQHRSVSAAHIKADNQCNKPINASMTLFPSAAASGSSQSVSSEYA